MYQGNDMPLGQRLVRGWNGPLPFYMSRPGYLGAKEEEKMLADLEKQYKREKEREEIGKFYEDLVDNLVSFLDQFE